MATDKSKITFYADADIDAAYQGLPHMQRSTWINEMIRRGMSRTDTGEGLRGLHTWLATSGGRSKLERELEILLAEYLEED